MRLLRVRFTVRRMMVAVAVVALILATGIVGLRWNRCRIQARSHYARAWGYSIEAANSYQLAYDDIRSGGTQASARPFAEEAYTWYRLAIYHDTLRRKYESAMWHPWEPVAPDPPEPE